jgi:O-antigen/teichoic acid export membrane protein
MSRAAPDSQRPPASPEASESAPPRGGRILTNALFNWAGYLCQIVIAFFLAPLLIHGLGDERYGVWALLESLVAYLMLFDAGIGASVVRYVARFDAAAEEKQLNRLFSTSLLLFAGLGLVVLAIVAALALACRAPLGVPEHLAADTRCMLLLLGTNLALQLPMGVYAAVLHGLGKYPVRNVVRVVSLLVRFGLLVGAVRAGHGLPGVAAATLVCDCSENLVLAVIVKLYLPRLRFAWRLVDRGTFRLIRGYSLDAFWTMLAGRLSFQIAPLVINGFLAPQFITFYMLSARLVEYAKNTVRSAVCVLTPAVSALEARQQFDAIRQVVLDSTRWVMYAIVPVQLGLHLLGKSFLALWVGPHHAEEAYPVLAILALPMAVALSQSVTIRVLYGLGKLRWLARVSLAQAAANLLLSILLAPHLGIEGVALGTTIPNLAFVAAVAWYVCRALSLNLADYLRRAFGKPIVLAPLPAAVWAACAASDAVTDWLSFLAVGLAGTMVYALAVLGWEFGPSAALAAGASTCGRLSVLFGKIRHAVDRRLPLLSRR